MRVSNVDKDQNDGELPVRLCNYVDVYKHSRITAAIPFMHATATPEEIERFRLQLDDVLITKDSEAWTDIGVPSLVRYSAPDLVCGYHLAMLRPFSVVVSGRYLFRALQSQGVATQIHVAANGVTRFGLSHGAIKAVVVPVPPIDEQDAIARFLDYADRRIRRYILAKQKLIRLLEEQKQAIIARAVIRGIDTNVRLKPSGVGWLGEIPKHWEVRRNGRLFGQRNQTGFAELPILEVSLRTGVRIRRFESGGRKQMMYDRDKYKRAAAGDIAYNMMRMWQGAVGVVPLDGLVSPAYVVASPIGDLDVRYYASLFRTSAYMGEVDACSRGIVKDRNRLYWEEFKQISSPYPPPDEQKRIADFIDSHAFSSDNAAAQLARESELLNEYRARLIADVVTGKLDVRDAAARLTDEVEAPDDMALDAVLDGEDDDDLSSDDVPEEASA